MSIAFSTGQLDKIKAAILEAHQDLDNNGRACNFMGDGAGGIEDLIPHFEAIERRVTALKYAYLAKVELFNAHKLEGKVYGSSKQAVEDQAQKYPDGKRRNPPR